MAAVSIEQVSKVLHGKTILHPLDIHLDKGEFVAIVGPSGSGKSTLLRMIAGLDMPSSGSIRLNGQCINTLPPASRDIAMVFQDYALYPHMTVYENMAYGLKRRGYKTAEIKGRVQEVANRLSIQAQLNKTPAQLSGGQKQRVAMGRALVRTPALYLFDEPLSNLDVSLRAQLRMEIKQLHQQSPITSLYVTHDQMEAMTLASKVVLLNHGKIEQCDSPSMLYAKPNNVFVGSFIGSHPMNLLPAKMNAEKDAIELPQGIFLPLPALAYTPPPQTQLLIGIRPEEMHVLYEDEAGEGLGVKEVYLDNMGADLLVRLQCMLTEQTFLARLSAREKQGRVVSKIMFNQLRAHVFVKETGARIGGWDA